MKNLVIVMAGDGSLHESYTASREFDLWVCFWGDDDEVADRFKQGCDRFFRVKGQKWALVREFGRIAREQQLPAFSSYEYVFLPDDDIEFPGGAADISKAIALAGKIGADVFQPAISNEYFYWEATRRLEGSVCHAATAVEIMMPAYSGVIFERCVLPLLHIHAHVRAGWGIELPITRFAETVQNRAVRTFVLDAVPAVHTRPLGAGTSSYALGWDEAFLIPLAAGNPIKELARFETAEEAADYEFPASDDAICWASLEKHLRRVRGARRLHMLARRKNILSYIINGLQKLAGRFLKD